MKSAREILYAKATENHDGFLSGQVRWILEAMEEYKNQFDQEEENFLDEQFNDHPDCLKALDALYNGKRDFDK